MALENNIVFADTLEVIDNIVLFSISNYFLRFSNEYKTVHQLKEFDNNWYEFVEYGTTNPITILLQRNGFSREVSTYFVNQIVEYIVHNGMMKDLSVLQEAPFTDHGSIVEVFTDLTVWMGIRNTIEKINSNAVA